MWLIYVWTFLNLKPLSLIICDHDLCPCQGKCYTEFYMFCLSVSLANKIRRLEEQGSLTSVKFKGRSSVRVLTSYKSQFSSTLRSWKEKSSVKFRVVSLAYLRWLWTWGKRLVWGLLRWGSGRIDPCYNGRSPPRPMLQKVHRCYSGGDGEWRSLSPKGPKFGTSWRAVSVLGLRVESVCCVGRKDDGHSGGSDVSRVQDTRFSFCCDFPVNTRRPRRECWGINTLRRGFWVRFWDEVLVSPALMGSPTDAPLLVGGRSGAGVSAPSEARPARRRVRAPLRWTRAERALGAVRRPGAGRQGPCRWSLRSGT